MSSALASYYASVGITPKKESGTTETSHSSSSGSSSNSSSHSASGLSNFYSKSSIAAIEKTSFPELSPDLSHASADDTFVPATKQRSAQEVLNDLDERYMTEDFDPVKELFNNLPPDEDQLLLTRLHELELVAATIDKKLSSQVQKNYHHFVKGLELITEISVDLKTSRNICQVSRTHLNRVDQGLNLSILSTLQKQRTMTRCKVVILRLHEVYNLLRQENEINALLKHDQFIHSVSIYKDCLQSLAQSGLNKFTCLDALRARFLRTAELINNQVKGRLLSLSKSFEYDAFKNLITAMINLGDYKVLIDHLKRLTTTLALEQSACEALYPFLAKDYMQSLISMQASMGMALAIESASTKKEQEGNTVAEREEEKTPANTQDHNPTASPTASSNGIPPVSSPSSTSSTPSSTPQKSPSNPFRDLSSPTEFLNQLANPTAVARGGVSMDVGSMPRKPFKDLVPHIAPGSFSLAFLTLASNLVQNLYAIHNMINILQTLLVEQRKKVKPSSAASVPAPSHSPDNGIAGEESSPHSVALSEDESICIALESASDFLHSSRKDVWAKMNEYFVLLLQSNYLSHSTISIEDLLRVLKKGEQFVQIGEKFVKLGPNSDLPASSTSITSTNPAASTLSPLRGVLQSKSLDYIHNFLLESLQNLSNSFVTESFKPLLVELDFNPDFHVKEFRNLLKQIEKSHKRAAASSDEKSDNEDGDIKEDKQSSAQLFEAFLSGANPFTRAILQQKHENEMREREVRLLREKREADAAAAVAANARPPIRAAGSGPVRANQLNLSVGRPRPTFIIPTVGGTTGGVPTVQPRAAAIAQAKGEQQAAAASPAVTATPNRNSISLPPGTSLISQTPSSAASATPVEPVRPFVLNTTLALIKIVGRYLSLLHSFPAQSLETLHGLQECVEFFCYNILYYMGSVNVNSGTGSASNPSVMGIQGFFVPLSKDAAAAAAGGSSSSASTVASQSHIHSELNSSTSSPNYLIESFPTLRSMLHSIKTRAERGQLGSGQQGPNSANVVSPALKSFGKEWKQDDILAAVMAVAAAQQALVDAQANSARESAAAASSAAVGGAPQTIAAAAAAQQAAAALVNEKLAKEKEKEKDSFFSKLKEKISSAADKNSGAGTASSLSSSTASSTPATSAAVAAANAVTWANQALSAAHAHLAYVSNSHPPPALAKLDPRVQSDLDSSDTLHGLLHRCAALEAVSYVATVLENHIKSLEPVLLKKPSPPSLTNGTTSADAQKQAVAAPPAAFEKRYIQFLQYSHNLFLELQKYLSDSFSVILLPRETFQSKLNSSRWDMKDLQTKYNAYVDTIINTLRVNEMSLQSSGQLPPVLLRKLWTSFLRYLTEQLVEAYSKTKKCTTEGRGLMTLDLSALRSGLEKLTNLKPLPYWDYVLSWVNAYYLQEADFIAWVHAHPEYTMSQVIDIASTGCGASKTAKERLVLVGNVTDAHAAAVDKAKKERAEEQRKKLAVGTPNPDSSTSSSTTSTPNPTAAAAAAIRNAAPSSTSASVSTAESRNGTTSLPNSNPASRTITPSASSSDLKQLDSKTEPSNYHAVLDNKIHDDDLP